MDFLSMIGLKPVNNSVTMQSEELKPSANKSQSNTVVCVVDTTDYAVERRAILDLVRYSDFYIEHESGLLKLRLLRVDDDCDFFFEDYECPDCDGQGGCSHCDLEHVAESDDDSQVTAVNP